MTWYYTSPGDGYPVKIYDHRGVAVREVERKDTGLRLPGDVLQAMEEEAMADGLQGGLSDRQIAILIDAVFENIEEGPPP